MKKYEYFSELIPTHNKGWLAEFNTYLNKLGEQGWRLVAKVNLQDVQDVNSLRFSPPIFLCTFEREKN